MWYVIVDEALIIELNPNIDLWCCFDKFRWLPTFEFKKTLNQEDLDFSWLGLWVGHTRRLEKQ